MARWVKVKRSSESKGSMRLGDKAVKAWKKTVEDSDKRKEEERKVVFR